MAWQALISEAGARIAGHVRRTPVAGLDLGGRAVALKLEQMQHTGSFKARGAFNTLLQAEVPEAALGHRARIYVPEIAGPAKTALIRAQGADLTVVPGAYAEAAERAAEWQAATGAMQVHTYDAEATVAGQGTVMAEWEEQGLSADTVLIAVGGGGLIAGALGWLEGRRKVVAVEPETSCALHAALRAGGPVDVEVSGVAANALGARRIGEICHGLAQAQGIASVLVPDAAITDAQALLWRDMRQLVEPAGATALAALLCGAYVPEPGERVAVLVCGGNIAPDPLA